MGKKKDAARRYAALKKAMRDYKTARAMTADDYAREEREKKAGIAEWGRVACAENGLPPRMARALRELLSTYEMLRDEEHYDDKEASE